MHEVIEFVAFARALAEEAGALITGHFRRTNAWRKSDGTLVTEADERANDLIVQRIAAAWPGHAILSEEGSTLYDPAASHTWVIDPLDGTTNFARGLPIWGVSVALLVDGSPAAAALTFPLLGESYWAGAGRGAWCNDEQLRTDQETVIDNQQIFTQCTRTRRRLRIRSPLKARMLGSAAYHLLAVARGASLAAVESTPKVWDLAGAALVAQEAGAAVAGLDGAAIFPLPQQNRDYGAVSWPTVAAANRQVWDEFRGSIEPQPT